MSDEIKIPVKSNGNNDWVEYRKLVLEKLAKIDKIADTQVLIRLDVRELKVRAAIWGGITAAIISTAIGAIVTKLADVW
jgi:hypothetical protein